MAGTTSGKVSIDVEADVSKFAAQLTKDLNEALRKVKIDFEPVARQMTEGFSQGVEECEQKLNELSNKGEKAFRSISEAAQKSGEEIKGAYDAASGTINLRFKENEDQSRKSTRNISRAFQDVGNSVANVGDRMTYSMTLPLAGVGIAGVATAANFEKAMNLVRAVTGATGDEFTRLRKQAIDLGSSTQFSASQAAEAMYYLTSAGFTVQQTYDAMPSVLNLAAAGVLDLGTAADIASNILNGFGLKAKDLNHVNDVLAKTMSATAVDMRMIGESMKYAAPIAASLKLSFEEVSAAIGLMGNAGIKGEMAGTSLRGALTRLIDPPREAATALEDLGVKVKDAHGQMLPLADILDQLSRKGASTADVMRIFGLEAGPGMQALLSQGAPALRDLTRQLQNAGGTADTMAKIQMQGLAGSWDNLTSSLEGLAIAIGDSGILADLTHFVDRATALVTALSRTNPELLKFGVATLAAVAALGPILAVLGRFMTSIGVVGGALKKLWPIIQKVGAALGITFGWELVAVIAAVAAVVGGLIYAYTHFERFRNVVLDVFHAVAQAGTWLWNTALRPALTAIGAALQAVGSWVANLWRTSWGPAVRGMGASIAAAWAGQIRPALTQLGAALTQLGIKIRDWWNNGGHQAFISAAHVVQWWYANVLFPVLKGAILLLGALAYALFYVFLHVVIPAVTATINVLRFFTNVWRAIFTAAQPVTQFMLTAFHVIAQVVSWWWNNVTMPALHGFMAVLRAVGAAVQFLWNVGVATFRAVAAVVQFFWSVAVAAFRVIAAGVGAVVAAVQWLWNTFSPLFIAIGQLVWAVWSGVLSVVFAVLTAEFTVIAAVVVVWWRAFTAAWSAVGSVVAAVWSGLIWPALQAVGNAFRALWTEWIWPALQAVGEAFVWLWGQAVRVWSAIMSAVDGPVRAIGGFFSWLWGQAVSIWNAIVSAVTGAVSRIVSVGGNVGAFVQAVVGHFTSAVNGVRDRVNEMASTASSIPGRIVSAVGNLGGLLVDAGRAAIQGLINGISSKLGDLRSMASQAASTIRGLFPFSPAKEGPLSGRGDLTIAGGKIVDMLAEGMQSRTPHLRLIAGDLAGAAAIGAPIARAITGATGTGGAGGTDTVSPAKTAVPSLRPVTTPPATTSNTGGGGNSTYYLTVTALDPKSAATSVIAAIKEFERNNGKTWRAA